MVSITGKGTRISPYTRAYTQRMFYLSNNDRNFKPACASTSHSVIPILHCEPFHGAVHGDWAALEEITTKQDPTTYGWHVQNNLIERRQISSGTQAWDISVAVASQPRLSHLSSLEQRRGGRGGGICSPSFWWRRSATNYTDQWSASTFRSRFRSRKERLRSSTLLWYPSNQKINTSNPLSHITHLISKCFLPDGMDKTRFTWRHVTSFLGHRASRIHPISSIMEHSISPVTGLTPRLLNTKTVGVSSTSGQVTRTNDELQCPPLLTDGSKMSSTCTPESIFHSLLPCATLVAQCTLWYPVSREYHFRANAWYDMHKRYA